MLFPKGPFALWQLKCQCPRMCFIIPIPYGVPKSEPHPIQVYLCFSIRLDHALHLCFFMLAFSICKSVDNARSGARATDKKLGHQNMWPQLGWSPKAVFAVQLNCSLSLTLSAQTASIFRRETHAFLESCFHPKGYLRWCPKPSPEVLLLMKEPQVIRLTWGNQLADSWSQLKKGPLEC